MTLMEVLVAMILTAALMTILMFFYKEASVLNTLNDRAIQENFQVRYIDNRLSDVFSHLIPEQDKKRPFYFFTTKALADAGVAEGKALIFGYNNGVKKDPLFSSDVLGVLFLDKFHRLNLITTSPPSTWENGISHINKEILMEHVEKLDFAFIEPEQTTVQQHTKPPELQTTSDWEFKKEKGAEKDIKMVERVPAIFKMGIELEKGDGDEGTRYRQFSFVLPRYKHPIVYIK